MSYVDLSHTLADAFNALADEVQALADQKTVLEHKLRFAHEQFQYLADKYAPANSEIAETLAKLQLPPHTSVDADESSTVPLPHRASPHSQHQIALVIRDGRRVANQLTSLADTSKTTGSSRETFSRASSPETSMSTALEQDFTIEGKKGNLQCPFSKLSAPDSVDPVGPEYGGPHDETPHASADPICAALYEEITSQPAPTNGSAAGKCPIRYFDKHTPEEIAHYVETHKHELPRSHAVCLRRYQRNEDEIRKLDSKYGNLVSMIEGLTHIHQPMLPETEQPQLHSDVDNVSNERVENWAKAVSATTNPEEHHDEIPVDADREGHFDRPLKEVRVGESPSRPWGISVPIYEPVGHEDDEQPLSPPPAPVRMTSPAQSTHVPPKRAGGKCPFDHTKFSAFPSLDPPSKPEMNHPSRPHPPPAEPFAAPVQDGPPPNSPPRLQPAPAFVGHDMPKAAGGPPQMVFTGPVFIGYPMDQAIQLLNHYRGNQ